MKIVEGETIIRRQGDGGARAGPAGRFLFSSFDRGIVGMDLDLDWD